MYQPSICQKTNFENVTFKFPIQLKYHFLRALWVGRSVSRSVLTFLNCKWFLRLYLRLYCRVSGLVSFSVAYTLLCLSVCPFLILFFHVLTCLHRYTFFFIRTQLIRTSRLHMAPKLKTCRDFKSQEKNFALDNI